MQNNSTKFKILILFILILAFVFPNFQGLILGEEDKSSSSRFADARVPEEERQALEAKLEKYEKQIAQYEASIVKTEREIAKVGIEKRTLRNQISLLRNRIGKLDTQIRQNKIAVGGLEYQIKDTKSFIQETFLKIEDSRKKLAAILRTIHQEDQTPMIEVFLAEARLSDFFDNLMALEVLNLRNQEVLDNIKTLKTHLEGQKQSLEEEKGDVEGLMAVQTLQKEEGARIRREQERFLGKTEAEYREYLRKKAGVERKKADVEKRAAELRARLFELVDIPDAPTFGEALELAQWVQQKTGIRPAFLLAIITQESALGRNVGRCYLQNFKTGRSIHVRTGKKMSRGMAPGPPYSRRNDVAHFLNITRELGRDPRRTLISCPMAFGWGGAMGPAQFIPSTWVGRLSILKEFIQNPDPWNIRHAFLASALYLEHLGGRHNERRAALRYFAGGNWANPRFAFYGDQVVKRINCFQVFIDHGTMTRACERMIFIQGAM